MFRCSERVQTEEKTPDENLLDMPKGVEDFGSHQPSTFVGSLK